MNEKWKKLLYELAKINIDFCIANLDKVNFGDRDFLIKTLLRLILRKTQTALTTENFATHFKDLWSNLQILVK